MFGLTELLICFAGLYIGLSLIAYYSFYKVMGNRTNKKTKPDEPSEPSVSERKL